jgi:hypothetical protein
MMQDKRKFNDLPDEFSTIFVESYWSEKLKAQRQTKTTTLILAFER